MPARAPRCATRVRRARRRGCARSRRETPRPVTDGGETRPCPRPPEAFDEGRPAVQVTRGDDDVLQPRATAPLLPAYVLIVASGRAVLLAVVLHHRARLLVEQVGVADEAPVEVLDTSVHPRLRQPGVLGPHEPQPRLGRTARSLPCQRQGLVHAARPAQRGPLEVRRHSTQGRDPGRHGHVDRHHPVAEMLEAAHLVDQRAPRVEAPDSLQGDDVLRAEQLVAPRDALVGAHTPARAECERDRPGVRRSARPAVEVRRTREAQRRPARDRSARRQQAGGLERPLLGPRRVDLGGHVPTGSDPAPPRSGSTRLGRTVPPARVHPRRDHRACSGRAAGLEGHAAEPAADPRCPARVRTRSVERSSYAWTVFRHQNRPNV